MYLPEEDVHQLLDRLTSHYQSGELIFDGVAPWLTRLSRAVHWGTRDAGQVERWNPWLRRIEQVSIGAGYDQIPNRGLRTVYQLGHRIPGWRHMLQGFRFFLAEPGGAGAWSRLR